ncbi:DUF2993 domain-containing protein [Streptomyces sp. NPDC087425]|uniref:LmeA family phospholipid-binding protein n=1 Tax=unclassified Streptomyces TaxID=2593676 RepID=UPI0037FCB26A
MRALRTLVIVVVILGGLFVLADRLALHFAEGQVADRLKSTENLARTPDVSIAGFPFLTQVASGELDSVEVGMDTYEAQTGAAAGQGPSTLRIDDLKADMKDVTFSGDYSSAKAKSATGTATISYAELLKAAKSEPTRVAPGVNAQVTGLSDGGNGKIKVTLKATVLGVQIPGPLTVLSTVAVEGDEVRARADSLPSFGSVTIAETMVRSITDFQQRIDGLPGGIRLDKVEAGKNGVEITVKGSNVTLAG